MHASSRATPEDVQAAIPNLVVVDEKWQTMLEPFFRRLFELPIFYSRIDRGRWCVVDDCVFECTKEKKETRDLLVQVCELMAKITTVEYFRGSFLCVTLLPRSVSVQILGKVPSREEVILLYL